jgi:hypothetical protein
VKHSREKGYACPHWEVSNEPWGKRRVRHARRLRAHLKAVGDAIRAAHPEA